MNIRRPSSLTLVVGRDLTQGVADLLEEALLVLRRDGGTHGLGELKQKVFLFAGEAGGRHDLCAYQHVATARTAQVGNAEPFEREDVAVLSAGGNVQRPGSIERGYLNLVSQGRLREVDAEVVDDVVLIAPEELVVLHAQQDVQVAPGAAVASHLAFARQAYLGAALDATGDPHVQSVGHLLAAGAPAFSARVRHHAALAAAAAAGCDVNELAEDTALDAPHLTAAAAGGALLHVGAGLRPQALAGRAQLRTLNLDLFLTAEDGLLEGDDETYAQVGAPLWSALTGSGGAEESVEDVAEAAETKTVEGAAEGALGSGVAKAVVGDSAIRVREDLVRLVDLLEPLLGTVLPVRSG
jgi:hypothetical protein